METKNAHYIAVIKTNQPTARRQLATRFGGAAHLHAVDGSANLYNTQDGRLEARETSPEVRHVRLSDGRIRSFKVPALPEPRSPESWHLRVEEAAPDGTVVHELHLDTLKDWREIEDLASVSRRGRYTTAVGRSGQTAWVSVVP